MTAAPLVPFSRIHTHAFQGRQQHLSHMPPRSMGMAATPPTFNSRMSQGLQQHLLRVPCLSSNLNFLQYGVVPSCDMALCLPAIWCRAFLQYGVVPSCYMVSCLPAKRCRRTSAGASALQPAGAAARQEPAHARIRWGAQVPVPGRTFVHRKEQLHPYHVL